MTDESERERYRRVWRSMLWSRRTYWASAALLPVVYIGKEVGPAVPVSLLFGAGFVCILGVGVGLYKLDTALCPRCGDPFVQRRGRKHPDPKRCRSCGLPFGAEPGEYEDDDADGREE